MGYKQLFIWIRIIWTPKTQLHKYICLWLTTQTARQWEYSSRKLFDIFEDILYANERIIQGYPKVEIRDATEQSAAECGD